MTKYNQIKLLPSSLSGVIKVPSSKSLSHRALICAALANGTSKIDNIVFSEDINTTIHALEQLGAQFEIKQDFVLVTGVKKLKYNHKAVDCNESGSSIRQLPQFVRSPPNTFSRSPCSGPVSASPVACCHNVPVSRSRTIIFRRQTASASNVKVWP